MFATTLLGFTVGTFWLIVFTIIWILLAFWPARVAARKGHSFWLYFLFSLVFFFAALLVAYIVPDRSRAPQAPVAPAPPATPTDDIG